LKTANSTTHNGLRRLVFDQDHLFVVMRETVFDSRKCAKTV
jgi:hypothetical protein